MKKIIRAALCAGVMAAALICGASAANTDGYTTAADATCTVTCDTQAGTYTAEYTQEGLSGQFVLLVVKGTENDYSISDETILYIDQTGAVEGKVSFTGFIPRTVSDGVVLLGGNFGDGQSSPKLLGTIIGQGFSVSGSVELEGRTSYAGAAAALTGGEETIPGAVTNAEGIWNLEGVPAGDGYQLKITMPGYLSYTKKNLSIQGDMELGSVKLLAGNVNGDTGINSDDLLAVLLEFGHKINTPVDINGDGGVNADDLLLVLINFGKKSVVEE